MIELPAQKARKKILLILSWQTAETELGIMKYAREANWSLDLRHLRTGTFPEPTGIDGILCLLGGWESRRKMTRFVRESGLPVVDMHADEIETVPAGRVLIDNKKAGELAAQHLITRGFTRCLFCCRSLSDWSARERQQSFSATLDARGILNEVFEHKSKKQHQAPAEDFVQHLMQTLEKTEFPVGIFAENDDIAILVQDACERLDIKTPEQAAVLGVGNDPLVVDFARVPLSSINVDIAGRAYSAARLLDQIIDGAPVPKQPILIQPPGVVTRQSSDILAVPDIRVASALVYIRRHFTHVDLNAEYVAKACDVPPRTLARLFKEHLERSVADEISRLRLQKAKQLMLETDLSASEIATQTGYASLLHLRRNFHRRLGISPRQWRLSRQEMNKWDT